MNLSRQFETVCCGIFHVLYVRLFGHVFHKILAKDSYNTVTPNWLAVARFALVPLYIKLPVLKK